MWAAQSLWHFNIWRIEEGSETIGASYIDEKGYFVPPRPLYVQLDYCMDHYLKRLEGRVLGRLEKDVFQRTRRASFSLFLAAFVFLAVVEGDTWRMENWKATLLKAANASPVSLSL